MKLTPAERAELRAHFKQMSWPEKADYIFTYYKIPIFVGLFVLFAICEVGQRMLTHKDPVVYLGMVNVAVGEEMEQTLTADFVEAVGRNPRKAEVPFYAGMYLSDDATVENHEYAYASRLKLMAAVNAQKLDVVVMNQEGYDLLSQSGYLLPLDDLCALPGLTENVVVLEDNSIAYQLREEEELRIVTETACNAVEVSRSSLLAQAEFSGAVYVGILANTPRVTDAVLYLYYLSGEAFPE